MTVSVATVPSSADTAVAGEDYVLKSGDDAEILTFDQNNSTREFTVNIINDELDENDETFTVELSSTGQFQSLVLADNDSAVGTIVDDDDEPTISIVNPNTPI